MRSRSPFSVAVASACLAACGGTPHEPAHAITAVKAPPPDAAPEVHELENLESTPPPKLLSIDWDHTRLETPADARAVWAQIAPTGKDWDQKLDEIPDLQAQPLALELLREGNFTCMKPQPTGECAKPVFDVDEPAETATIDDPCLRRHLAMWAFQHVDGSDKDLRDALRAIAAIPLPETQLVASAIAALPEDDQDGRLELLAIAWQAGQHEIVNTSLGGLDEDHLRTAATKLHIDGALEILPAETNRPVFLAAIADEKLAPAARRAAMIELAGVADAADQPLPPDLRSSLAAATKSPECGVAAQAIRIFHDHKDDRFVPPRSAKTAMRALCVIANLDLLARNDEAAVAGLLVPPRGLDVVTVTYDPYGEADPDGDGDPHTERTTMLLPKAEVVLPEIEDMVHALAHCTGTTCRSEAHEFRFVWKGAFLSRIEVIERPPCPNKPGLPSP